MGRKVFVAGEILTASDVNTNLMDQSVMVFDDATARTTAIPTPVEGMVTYLSDEDEVQVFDGSAFKAVGPGKILQVVSVTKTDPFTSASASFTIVTGLSATITPSATSSKVLVVASISGGTDSGTQGYVQLFRGSALSVGDAAGSRVRATTQIGLLSSNAQHSVSFNFLDSPATTSAITYEVQVRNQGAQTVYINRSQTDGGSPSSARTTSSITVMEVAG